MARPADLDVGEINDKGYLNQRQVLATRAALVDLLYGEPPRPASSSRKGQRDAAEERGEPRR
jgi:hypothetical protein